MKAIIIKQNKNGTYDECGMNNRHLTSHYKTIESLLRYGIAKRFSGKVRIELFFDSIYQEKPDDILYVEFAKGRE
jgi:hypothetical protein